MISENVKVPELVDAMEYIDAHPEEHDQTKWAIRRPCGTAFCLAGTGLVRNGWTPNWRRRNVWDDHTQDYAWLETCDTFTSPDGWVRDPHDAGRELFGLTDQVAGDLFSCENSLFRLRTLVEDLTDGAYHHDTDTEEEQS